jgi:hypothetical protein
MQLTGRLHVAPSIWAVSDCCPVRTTVDLRPETVHR